MKRKPTLYVLLVIFLSLVPCVSGAQYDRFAIVSDTHVGAPNSRYAAFIKQVKAEGIDTVIHTGDAINVPGDQTQWSRFRELGAKEKVLLTPGNHDISDQKSFSTYLSLYHRPYYSVSDRDTLFVFLNTEIPGHRRRIDGEQLTWLEAELDKPCQHKLVFLHEPLYPFLPGNGLDRYRKERNSLHLLFVKKGVSLVVAGHDHVYDRTERDGVEYVIMAAAGGRIPWFIKNTEPFNYMVVTRNSEGYTFEMKSLSGQVKDRFALNGPPSHDGSPSSRMASAVGWSRALRIRLRRLVAVTPFGHGGLRVEASSGRVAE